MSKLVRFVSTIPAGANWLASGTLTTWLVKAAWLDTIPATSGAINGAGHVVDGLLSAIIAGYVFYLLFALWPDFSAREGMRPFILRRVSSVAGNCSAIMKQVETASGRGLTLWGIARKDVEKAFASTPMTPGPNMTIGARPASWIEFFDYHRRRTNESLSELFQQGRFLEPELVVLLGEVQDDVFMKQIALIGSTPLNNVDLTFLGSDFYRYLDQVRKLARWYDANKLPGTPKLLED